MFFLLYQHTCTDDSIFDDFQKNSDSLRVEKQEGGRERLRKAGMNCVM